MSKQFLAITAFVGLTGCAQMPYPQNAAEYRSQVSAPYIEKLEVERPFSTVSDVLKRKSIECLNATVVRQWKENYVPRKIKVRYRSAMRQNATGTELQVQVDDGFRPVGQKVPPGGMYIVVADLHRVGTDRTRVEIYGGGDWYYKSVGEAIKKWAAGSSLACPNLP